MSSKKELRNKLDAQLAGAVSGQIPVNVMKDTYLRMLKHAGTSQGVWTCKESGSRIKLRMVRVNVYSVEGKLLNMDVPVGSLYCDRCDSIPALKKNDSVWDTDLQTLYV